MNKTLLFNPVGVVHARTIGTFRDRLPGWHIRSIYNKRHPWFAENKKYISSDTCYFSNGRVPADALDGVDAVVLFRRRPVFRIAILCSRPL